MGKLLNSAWHLNIYIYIPCLDGRRFQSSNSSLIHPVIIYRKPDS